MVSENKSNSFQISFPQLKSHPQWKVTHSILSKLKKAGYEALIAGGAVRDLLMGRMPGDLDVASSAKPEEVENLFSGQTIAVGKAFGVIRVIMTGHSIEVATYRKDLEYQDGRRPEGVVFTNRIEDAKRRDFTINALFYDAETETFYDDVDGKKDLDAKILRTVGLAQERFQEDELRRLRLVRFVSQLGFRIEEKTRAALDSGIEGLNKISKERITEEIGKMWQGSSLPEAYQIWLDSGMARIVDPAWEKSSNLTNDLIWNLPRADKTEAWVHYFSFFFEEENLKAHYKLLRLPKEIEKFVDSVHLAYRNMPQFLSARKGEQIFQASQKSFLLALEYFICKKSSPNESSKLKSLLLQFQNQSPLPEPLIKALHIQDRFQGPALGKMLRQLYIEQLDQNWKTSEQALEWLRKNSST